MKTSKISIDIKELSEEDRSLINDNLNGIISLVSQIELKCGLTATIIDKDKGANYYHALSTGYAGVISKLILSYMNNILKDNCVNDIHSMILYSMCMYISTILSCAEGENQDKLKENAAKEFLLNFCEGITKGIDEIYQTMIKPTVDHVNKD